MASYSQGETGTQEPAEVTTFLPIHPQKTPEC